MEKPPEQVHRQIAAAAAARRKRYLLRCCSCTGAALLLAAVLLTALILTVFRLRAPSMTITRSAVDLDLVPGTALPRPGSNATIRAVVAVRNPNFVSFRHGGSPAAPVYYRAAAVGVARAPPGRMPARRTARMNATIVVIMDRVLANPGFGEDLAAGSAEIGWFTRFGGRAEFWVFKKHVTIRMNCTAKVDVVKMALMKYECKPKVKLFGG